MHAEIPENDFTGEGNAPTVTNGKILLVTINTDLGRLLVDNLQLPCQMVTGTGEALQAVADHVFSVIVVDCLLPSMDGFEFTKAVRRLEQSRKSYTPIIACVTRDLCGDYQKLVHCGADDLILKPVSKDLLRVKLLHWTQQDIVKRNATLSQVAAY